MKLALCLSGQPRDVDIIYPILKQSILDDNDVDVFVHTWWDPENLSHKSVIPDRVHKSFSPNSPITASPSKTATVSTNRPVIPTGKKRIVL